MNVKKVIGCQEMFRNHGLNLTFRVADGQLDLEGIWFIKVLAH